MIHAESRVPKAAARLLFAAAIVGLHGPCAAQVPAEQIGPEIVVTAPRSVPVPTERRAFAGEPVLIATVKIAVRFGDLDLKNPGSADRLFSRIKRVAQDACGQLDRLYPLSPDPNCVANAVAEARPAAEKALKSAKS